MDLPQPQHGQHPNIEVLWAGDATTGHLSVSLRVGTFFGVSNAFSQRIAHEIVDCEQLCECDILADTGDLMASFHVAPEHWPDFAHALLRKVYGFITINPAELNCRNISQPNAHVVGDCVVRTSSRRVN